MFRSKKTVLLMGGIGNRLFQITRAVDLKRNGYNVQVINVEQFSELNIITEKKLGWTQHHFWLDINILIKDLGLISAEVTQSTRIKVYYELLRIRGLKQRYRLNLSLNDDNRTLQIGYFQNPSCITKESLNIVASSLLHILPPINRKRDEAVIHVRGGDFALIDRLANSEIDDFLHKHGKSCICVTNDSEYIHLNYPKLPIVKSSKGAQEDFMILAKARMIYPSNSTFCFWACVIAVRNFDAKILKRPNDTYWSYLDEYIVNNDV